VHGHPAAAGFQPLYTMELRQPGIWLTLAGHWLLHNGHLRKTIGVRANQRLRAGLVCVLALLYGAFAAS